MKKKILIGFACIALFACNKGDEETNPDLDGKLAGGETTVFISNSQAFGTPAPNLSTESLERHMEGDAAFEAIFVSSSAPTHGGLGPVFNNTSCIACHPADGRASVPENVNALSGFFFRISIPGEDRHGGPNPVPGFGTQMQHQALYGFEPEAKMGRQYEYIDVELGDGSVVTLQKPIYSIVDPYMSIPGDVQISPRIGMPVFGLGLLEAISEDDILANADEHDVDGDGISGKPNYVWDVVTQSVQLGRFGWKAGAASLLAQSAGAYSEDMGLTTELLPVEASEGQTNGDQEFISPEVSREELEAVTFYCMTLGVPAARKREDEIVKRGSKIFTQLDCNKCHTPSFTTGDFPEVPELGNQTIYPYTDMLLHDMGEALADNRTEFKANGQEWKTRPLWGVGLTKVTSGTTNFLHDGRARNVIEAILWHGGEAQESTDKFIALSKEDREALLVFVNSL